jgi:hypothetical protein
MADEALKRIAIVGTAPSWKQVPWADQGLLIAGLNDAYVLGQPRADLWFDLHPPSHWLFYDKAQPPTIDQVPPGTYLRPNGHREWIASRPFPVFLHEARPDWPNSRRFPREAVLAFWKPYWPFRVNRQGLVSDGPDYEASSPAWMYMWAVMEGFREIHIYGIHLATEWEYLRQRPNMEFLMGVGAGLGVKHILPETAPLCRSGFQYGYEVKDDAKLEPLQRRVEAAKFELAQLQQRGAGLRWYDRGRQTDLQARRAIVDLELQDAQMALRQQRIRVA